MPEIEYDAFISYRRSDGAVVARWLRRELVGFRVPRSLRDRFDRRLKIYLDTACERGTSDFYEQSIRPALLASRHLLVVATPDAIRHADRANDWIDREVSDFAAGPNGRNVVAVRGAGEFDDPLPGEIRSRFPNIEIVDLRGAGRLWRLNPTRAARLSAEKLKLVAPLLDIPREDTPKLRQEEERQQQFRMGTAMGAALGVLVAVSGLSVFALQSRNQAIRSLEDSMFATGSMVLLSSGLAQNRDDASGRTRRLLIVQGCDLIDKLGLRSGRDPQIGELVTCRLERAASREQLGEQAEARAQYEDAIALATERYARTPRADAAARLVQARQAYAAYLFRQNDNAAAEAEYGRLRDDARRLGGALRDRAELVRAEGDALAQLGDLLLIRDDRVQAAASFDQAADAVGREIGIEGERTSRQTVARLALLYRRAGEQHMQSDDPDGALERFNRSLAARSLIAADRIEPSFEQEDAVTHALIFVLERRRGNSAAAEKASAEALAAIERVLSAAGSAPNLKQRSAGLKTWIEQQMAGK